MRKVAARTGQASLEAADTLLWAFQQAQEHGAPGSGDELLLRTDDGEALAGGRVLALAPLFSVR